MPPIKPQHVAAFFGLSVITSGLVRFFERPDGEKGLWFGVVMGCVPLLAAVMFHYGKRGIANILSFLAIAFVGGWFVYEALIKKGWTEAEPRMLIIIGITAAVAIFFLQNAFTSKTSEPTHG